jgi:hypothetical protein
MKKNKSHPVSIFQRVRYILILIIFVVVFVLHVQGGIHLILGRLIQDLRELHSSYDEKMRRRRGWYDFVSFIRENTPEEASILFPPGNYEKIGDPGLNHYFLLPRRLYTGNRHMLQTLRLPIYVIVLKEFPAFEVEGSRIMKDSEKGLIHYRPNP